MDPTQSHIGSLSGDDRVVYRQWLRRTVLFYSSVIALLAFAAFANQMFSAPSGLAGDTVHTTEIAAQK